ncbi:MAG: HAMP domain-containing protein [Thermoplasmata archaeon]|nr:HAMP domain-containing protein [Thermoplasmata archaeon]
MLASLALYSSVTSRDAIAEGVGLASEAIAESLSESMDKLIYLRSHEIATMMSSFKVIEWVSESNAAFDAMEDPQGYIDQTDENWTLTPLDVVPEFMEAVLENNISLLLRDRFLEHYVFEHGMQVFGEVILTNKYGALISATGRTTDFRQDDESWWHSAQEAELVISNMSYDESSGSYGVCACAPVWDSAGETIGVAKAMINMLSIAKDIELTDLGYETSELKIVTSDGRMIFASRAYVILQNISSSSFFEHAVGERGHFSDREGETDRLFSFATSTGYLEYEGDGWLVFLSHAEDEVLGPATELQIRILTVAALGLVLGAVIAAALSRSITSPISALEAATRGMARGELAQRITVTREDELGRLAKSFNDMASELELSYSGLEEKVKERTADLENVNKRLGVLSSITRHDALNQMTVQRGWLGMAMEVSKDPVVSDYLSKVEGTTDNLVSFFQFTSQYEEVGINKPEWVEVREAFVSATAGLDLTGTELSSRLEGVEVFADPMFPKVLHNLVSNSLKHGQTVTAISLSYSEGPDGLTMVMVDNGVGVPAERKEAIFQRSLVPGRRSHGLFLSAEILGITKISIRETGVVGEGARFEILVPEGKYRFVDGSPSET